MLRLLRRIIDRANRRSRGSPAAAGMYWLPEDDSTAGPNEQSPGGFDRAYLEDGADEADQEQREVDHRSTELFSGVTTVVYASPLGSLTKASQAIFGRELEAAEYRCLVGALGGSRVCVTVDDDSLAPPLIRFRISHPDYYLHGEVFGNKRGRGFCTHHLTVAEAAQHGGIATRITLMQVASCRLLGVGRLELYPVSDSHGKNGNYTWPRLGYSRTVDRYRAAELPAEYQGCRTLADLMLAGGHEWWRSYSSRRDVVVSKLEFATEPGSESSRVLDAYAEARGIVAPHCSELLPVNLVVDEVGCRDLPY